MKKIPLILLALFSANAAAALYKWEDANGRVTYSDQPPPPNSRTMKVVPPPETTAPAKTDSGPAANAPAAVAPAAQKTAAEQEAEKKKARQEAADKAKQAEEKAAQEQARAEIYKANCENAQGNLRILQQGTRIMEVDANGQRSFLDDAQRKQRIEKAQQDIDTYCK